MDSRWSESIDRERAPSDERRGDETQRVHDSPCKYAGALEPQARRVGDADHMVKADRPFIDHRDGFLPDSGLHRRPLSS